MSVSAKGHLVTTRVVTCADLGCDVSAHVSSPGQAYEQGWRLRQIDGAYIDGALLWHCPSHAKKAVASSVAHAPAIPEPTS